MLLLPRLYRALSVATQSHGDQKQKYTGLPYIVHPIAVAGLIEKAFNIDGENRDHIELVTAAAVLHDVLEDTDYTPTRMLRDFGTDITRLVVEVTDVSRPNDGNRAVRKAKDREHLSHASPDAQTIKLADLYDNTSTIMALDPKFGAVYLEEKKLLLPVLKDGNRWLHCWIYHQLNGLSFSNDLVGIFNEAA